LVESIGLAQVLTEYERVHLASRNLAPRTRTEYLGDLRLLLTFLNERCHLTVVQEVQLAHLNAYLAELDRKGYSGAARRRQLSSIKSLFHFLLETGAISADPTQKLIPPEREYKQPRVLTEPEYKRLQLTCAHQTRDAAIIEVLLQTGMRLSELSRLTVAQLELPVKVTRDVTSVGAVRIFGKGRKDRTLTLNWKACRAIKAYLAIRPKVDDPRLFLTKFGQGIGPRAIENVVSKYLEEAGIEGASVHTLRHTFAKEHVKRGTRLPVVQKALGHESLQTTSIYVDLAREEMDKALQQNAL
jgi:site-specific recombinase XerD